MPTKSVSQKLQAASARSSSRPDHRLHPAKRQNTDGRPVNAPSPCSVKNFSLPANSLRLGVSPPPVAAQIAGGALAAAITPVMTLPPLTEIAAVALFADQLDQGIAAQFLRQLPGRT